MGTRGLVGFFANGKPLLTYVQYDSYPEGLGTETLNYVTKNLVQSSDGGMEFDPEKLAKILALVSVEQHAEPTPPQLQQLAGKYWENVSTGKDWYSHLRRCQGDLDMYVAAGFIPDQSDFGKDSLFCENAYVIDVDAKSFDYYEGFNEAEVLIEEDGTEYLKPEEDGIWAGVKIPRSEEITRDDGSTYTMTSKYGVVVRTVQFPFAEIPALTDEEFLKRIRIAPRARHRENYDADGNYVEEKEDVDA